MTASQKAMLLAMEFPDDGVRGRGKKDQGGENAETLGFSRDLLRNARLIVRWAGEYADRVAAGAVKWAPELITGVMGGAVKFMKMATRIRDRAIRRAGELLKQIEPNKGGRPSETGVAADTSFTRKDAAEAAGMSKRQAVTAIRVANVPAAEFEKQVESPNPPTVMPPLTRGRGQGAGLARSADP